MKKIFLFTILFLLIVSYSFSATNPYIAGSSYTARSWNEGLLTDADVVAIYNLESGALGTNSKADNNHLTVDGVAASATKKQGSYSGDFELSETDFMYLADASLSADFPGKSGTTNKTFSICAWIYIESSDGVMNVVSKWGDTGENTRTYGLALNNAGTVYWNLGYNSGGAADYLTHATTLSDANWYHICGTYENTGKTYGIYIRDTNGTTVGSDKEDTTTLDVNGLSNDSEPFRIGAKSTSAAESGFFDGLIDEVVIFKKKITATDATNIAKGLY